MSRYEIVLLDDDAATLALLTKQLSARDIGVRAFSRGEDALAEIQRDPNIGALLTDIEILDSYPDGSVTGFQGYDVANRIPAEAPNHLLSVVVMTRLPGDAAFDNLNTFSVPITTVHKSKWMDAEDDAGRVRAFDELAGRLKEAIERVPKDYYDELERDWPKSRWITHEYWSVYREMWFSKDWPTTEAAIGRRAAQIVRGYLDGSEDKRLRREILSFSEDPKTEGEFKDHLIGRRVIYGMKLMDRAYWAHRVDGERVVEEDRLIPGGICQAIQSDEVTRLYGELNKLSVRRRLAELDEKGWKLWTSDERTRYQTAKKDAELAVGALGLALEAEPEEVRLAFVRVLRYWDANFAEVSWFSAKKLQAKREQRLKTLLNMLSIRREDIEDDDPENWKLLLPEERAWLKCLGEEQG